MKNKISKLKKKTNQQSSVFLCGLCGEKKVYHGEHGGAQRNEKQNF